MAKLSSTDTGTEVSHCLDSLLEKEHGLEDKKSSHTNSEKRSLKGDFRQKYSQFKQQNSIPEPAKVFVLDKELFKPLYDALIARKWFHVEFETLFLYKQPFFDFYYGPAALLGENGIKKFGARHILNFVDGTHSIAKKRGLAAFMKSSVYLKDDLTKKKKNQNLKKNPRFGKGGPKKVCTKGLELPEGYNSGIWEYNTSSKSWEIVKIQEKEKFNHWQNFFPRSYDLEDQDQMTTWLWDYQLEAMHAIIRTFSLILISLQTKFQNRLSTELKTQVEQILARSMTHLGNELNSMAKNIASFDLEQLQLYSKHYPHTSAMQQFGKVLIRHLKTDPSDDQNKSEFSQHLEKMSEITKDYTIRRTDDKDFFSELHNPQNKLNTGKNLWIIKPSGLSRGRGIKVFSKLDEMLHYVISSDCGFVSQKYIENASLIFQRRFDIRQWVIITNFEKMEFLFWDEFYVRLCSTEYSSEEDHLKDSFRHLANNSINKNVDENLKNSTPFQNNIASQGQFEEYLEEFGSIADGKGRVEEIKSDMMEVVAVTVMSSLKKTVEWHKSSFLVLGFDFMLLDRYEKPQLIEVNLSPAMDFSSDVTERMCTEFLTQVGNLVHTGLLGQKKGLDQMGLGDKIGKFILSFKE